MEGELPLSLIEKRNGKKEVVLQEEDWNGLEIKTISELFVANQVIFIIMSFYLESYLVSVDFSKHNMVITDLI